MHGPTDFGKVFERLAREQQSEETGPLGGVNVRLVRVAGGGEGRWDSHGHSTEIVVVWSGDFTVEFRDHTLNLAAGQCAASCRSGPSTEARRAMAPRSCCSSRRADVQ